MVSVAAIAPLFVPADRPDRYAKAAASGADAIVIDLEDAVAPAAKAAARGVVVAPGALPRATVWVRVNAGGTPWHEDDVAALARLDGLAAVIAPKAESAQAMAALHRALGARPVIALVETARGLAAAREIAGGEGVARLAFGSIDYCADLGLAHTREALLAARSEVVLASRLAGLPPPLDGVTTDIVDAGLASSDARHARDLGFGGKLCIHPTQIAAVLSGFAPSAEETAWAERVAAAGGEGAVRLDGTMIDAPVRARVRAILERAARAAGGPAPGGR